MLDVHAPEHRVGGIRDFFIHLLTITVGLLIALGLENAAEAIHHRHQRREAEASIRQELQQNRDDLLKEKATLEEEISNMRAVLAFVTARSQNQKADAGNLHEVFHEAPIQDAAWRTAASTGALSYMDYADVQRYSTAYKEQELLQKTAEQALDDYLQLGSFVSADHPPERLSPQEAASALPYVRQALGHLLGMYDVGVGTLGTYNEALK